MAIELWEYEEADLLAASPIQDYQAEVERITVLPHDIRGIHLRLLEPAEINFKAEQYIDLLVPATNASRSYSLANPPSHKDTVELKIKVMAGRLYSAYVA